MNNELSSPELLKAFLTNITLSSLMDTLEFSCGFTNDEAHDWVNQSYRSIGLPVPTETQSQADYRRSNYLSQLQ